MDSEGGSQDLIARLVMDHLTKFPYTNIQLFSQGCLDREKRKTPDIFYHPPCYCLQHNEYMRKELLSNGFDDIKRMSALVVNSFEGEGDENILSDTLIAHDVLFVNGEYIVDVGFSSNSLRGPLRFRGIEEEVRLQHDSYKFKHCVGFKHYTQADVEWWGVHVLVGTKWLELWRFPIGLELDDSGVHELNESLTHSTKPVGIRDSKFLVAKVTPTTRESIFAFKGAKEKPVLKLLSVPTAEGSEGGGGRSTELDTWEEFTAALREYFDQPPPPDVVRQCFYSDSCG